MSLTCLSTLSTHISSLISCQIFFRNLDFLFCSFFFFFKQKTAYEMRISDWSSDVCSSDLLHGRVIGRAKTLVARMAHRGNQLLLPAGLADHRRAAQVRRQCEFFLCEVADLAGHRTEYQMTAGRSEEHTSELQSLMRISYAVFCLK